MPEHVDVSPSRIGKVVARSLLVGAIAGVVGGGLLFFIFGFIGFAGAPLSTKLANGWRALLDPGLGKGLVVGAGIAVGLIVVIGVWTALAPGFDPRRARPWLASLAGAVVIVFNLDSLRNARGWDLAGVATVIGISLLAAGIVWFVAPWVLRDWPQRARVGADQATRGFTLREDG